MVGITRVDEGVADERGDDRWVQGRAVLEVCANGLERVFRAAIKDTKGNGGDAALVEVGSCSEGFRAWSTTWSSWDVGKVGLDTQGSVELISLSTTSDVGNCSDGILASGDGGSGSLALVVEDVADGGQDNLTVESRALSELGPVLWLEAEFAQFATIKSGALFVWSVSTTSLKDQNSRIRQRG